MLKKYIQNLERSNLPAGQKPKFKDILGDENNVARLGGFFHDNSDLLLVASLHCFLEYTQAEEFDSKESTAYKRGIDDLMDFLRGCASENLNGNLLQSENEDDLI